MFHRYCCPFSCTRFTRHDPSRPESFKLQPIIAFYFGSVPILAAVTLNTRPPVVIVPDHKKLPRATPFDGGRVSCPGKVVMIAAHYRIPYAGMTAHHHHHHHLAGRCRPFPDVGRIRWPSDERGFPRHIVNRWKHVYRPSKVCLIN